MNYAAFNRTPIGIGGYGGPGFLGGFGKPPACPPLRLVCDLDCPLPAPFCMARKKDLCDRIIAAISLANRAAWRLEDVLGLRPKTQTPSQTSATFALFHQVFGQAASDPWEIPGLPGQTMKAGAMVAQRFRAVARELTTRDTIYRCVSVNRCLTMKSSPCSSGTGSGGPAVSSSSGHLGDPTTNGGCHPTDTVVVDAAAMALLCKNEVWLCPPFWQLKNFWQEGTIVHEMLHLCFGLTCAWFQHDQKERKRNSANCYEVFATDGPALADPASVTACTNTPQ
jgi:hypothetical protein